MLDAFYNRRDDGVDQEIHGEELVSVGDSGGGREGRDLLRGHN